MLARLSLSIREDSCCSESCEASHGDRQTNVREVQGGKGHHPIKAAPKAPGGGPDDFPYGGRREFTNQRNVLGKKAAKFMP
jgi:hypothetical protein